MLARVSEKMNKNFPLVCVGGSAGGLDAYIRLLCSWPVDLGTAIVIVNHLRTTATLLREILPDYIKMPVELISEGLHIKPNCVFIIPSHRDLHVLLASSASGPSPNQEVGQTSSRFSCVLWRSTGGVSSSPSSSQVSMATGLLRSATYATLVA